MKQLTVVFLLVCLCGCEGLRYAATETQKENALLHERVCAAAAETAASENVSQALCGLTELAHDQSGAFVMDYGLPTPSPLRSTPPWQGESLVAFSDGELNDILSQAKADSMRKPDVWSLADNAMELGIALAGLVGGVYGIRIVGYLKKAREKSRAIKEIVAGNELFKQLWPEHADRFKEAQRRQSPATKQIVTAVRAE